MPKVSCLLILALLITTSCSFIAEQRRKDRELYNRQIARIEEERESRLYLSFLKNNADECARTVALDLDIDSVPDCRHHFYRKEVQKKFHFYKDLLSKANPTQEQLTRIKKGAVRIGMSEDMARLAWGSPSSVNTTTTAHGTAKQYVYDCEYTYNYLYFENGKLTAIQN